MNRRKFIYFGPVCVAIEWSGFIVADTLRGFQPNKAISLLTVAPAPLPLVFGLTLTLAALSFMLFCLPLSIYSKKIPWFGLVAGIGFILTGWIPFRGTENIIDIMHNLSIYSATAASIVIIWLMRRHPKFHISVYSTFTVVLLILTTIMSFLSLLAVHKYIADVQIVIALLAQLWILYIAFSEHRILRTT